MRVRVSRSRPAAADEGNAVRATARGRLGSLVFYPLAPWGWEWLGFRLAKVGLKGGKSGRAHAALGGLKGGKSGRAHAALEGH